MLVPLAAYRLMLQVAEAHQGLDAEEIRLLERYRRALGVTREQALEPTLTPVTQRMVEGSQREREEAILAMARVAFADGALSTREREHILEVAEELGVERVQCANLLHRAEEEYVTRTSAHKRARSGRNVALAGVGVLLAVAAWITFHSSGTQAAERLRALARDYDDSIVLVRVSYRLVKEGEKPLEMGGTGTGFFVDEEGLIVTNKHVVQPWKFLASAVKRFDDGYALDENSIELAAWPVGARIRDEEGELDFSDAFSTAAGTLEIAGLAKDRWVRSTRSTGDGEKHKGRYHALDHHDLAVLDAQVARPVEALPITKRRRPIGPLDPVVVLGFPRGTRMMEGETVISSPCSGEVRKLEESILLSAPIDSGNSGGPVIGPDGDVVGVASLKFKGPDGPCRCIRAKYVRALL